MPIRLTVGRLMLVVASLAVVLAAGRVHVSLGSLAFGILSIAGVRTARRIERRRADGAEPGRLGAAGEFCLELGAAAATLGVAALPAAVVAFVVVGFDEANNRGRGPTGPGMMVAAAAAGLAGAGTLRLSRKP